MGMFDYVKCLCKLPNNDGLIYRQDVKFQTKDFPAYGINSSWYGSLSIITINEDGSLSVEWENEEYSSKGEEYLNQINDYELLFYGDGYEYLAIIKNKIVKHIYEVIGGYSL